MKGHFREGRMMYFERKRMNSNERGTPSRKNTTYKDMLFFFRRPTVVHSFWVKRHKAIEARKETVIETEVRFSWELYLQ